MSVNLDWIGHTHEKLNKYDKKCNIGNAFSHPGPQNFLNMKTYIQYILWYINFATGGISYFVYLWWIIILLLCIQIHITVLLASF